MKSIRFDEFNKTLAEDQPEYNRVYTYHGQIGNTPEHIGFICCFEVTEYEIHKIAKEKKIWLSQLTFGQKFNPIVLNVLNPFDHDDFSISQENLLGKTKVEIKLSFIDRLKLLFSNKPVVISLKHLGNIGSMQVENLKQKSIQSVFENNLSKYP